MNHLGIQLGDLLQGPGSPFLPGAHRLTEPFKTESKKADDPEASLSSEEERAGVENVRSQTYSKELLQRPPHARPGPGRPGATPLWTPAAPQGDLHLGAGAQGPPSPGLRLQVQPPEEEYGYIVMENERVGGSISWARSGAAGQGHAFAFPSSPGGVPTPAVRENSRQSARPPDPCSGRGPRA